MGGKLRPKYVVLRIDERKATAKDYSGTPPVLSSTMLATDSDNIDSPFVLLPRKDPAAFYALLNYAQMCEEGLAREIRVWLEKVVSAPPVYGTQGERNRVSMKLKQMDLVI